MARKIVQASALGVGDKIVAVGKEDVTNRRLVVTKITRGTNGQGRSVNITGTSRGGKEKMLFERVAPNKPITLSGE